jgi:CubicO group peptidase (beta-lactamase class C family)
MPSLDQTSLQQSLDTLAQKHQMVGASVAVLTGDAAITAATGVANLRSGLPVTPDTIFQIGSITKAYTATLVMQLVDEGLVDLDAPVRTYLPEFAVADAAATSSVTVRQLLSHTSGIDGDVFEDFGRGDDCVEKFVGAMGGLEQTSEPGAFFSYCNSGYTLLGRLIEHFREMSWDAALRKYLLDPLGAKDSVTLPEEAIMRAVAVGHLPTGEDKAAEVAPVWHLSRASSPAGAISATPTELLAFARMHLDDGRAADGTQVLSPAIAKSMQQLQIRLPEAHTLGEGWGLGWILYRLDGPAVIGHDGSTIGQQAYMRIVPEHSFAVALLTNGGHAAGALFNDLCRPLLRAHTGAVLTSPAIPPDPSPKVDPTPFLGVYERSGIRQEIRYDDSGALVLASTPTGPLAKLMPAEEPRPLVVLNDTALITAEPEDRLGQHLVLQFLSPGPDGFAHIHLGGRATPRVVGPTQVGR